MLNTIVRMKKENDCILNLYAPVNITTFFAIFNDTHIFLGCEMKNYTQREREPQERERACRLCRGL
jgi:hypothetical protein